jgi:prolyl-tRNA synthetase
LLLSKLLGKTLREAPAEADNISHQLLVRGGYIQQLATGIYTYLPLGWRVLNRVINIIRDEMDRAGGQEVLLPALQPIELWFQSGRFDGMSEILFTLKDRRERELALGPTHEEVITETVRRCVQSYRDLPVLPYQIQTKFRDEPRPRGGLLRVREFIMKDLYSFDADEAGLDVSYRAMVQAYKNIYQRCGIKALMVEADSGAIGGKESQEFMVIADSGEDEIISCPKCGYAANVEKARFVKRPGVKGELLPMEEVATPGKKTIEEVAGFLGVTPAQTLKVVLYAADGALVMAVIRGDLPVNEIKLKNLLKCVDLRLATDEEVRGVGLTAGFASPAGVKGVRVVADDSIELGCNYVAGGNKPDCHVRNLNPGRDFKPDVVADIAAARAGDGCPKCDGILGTVRGIEAGHVFKLGTFLSEKFNGFYLDKDGASRPMVMGCYGIGVGRLLAAVVEQCHDEKGIIWPETVAPFDVHLCPLFITNPKVMQAAEEIRKSLEAGGVWVLVDDRDAAPGVKFNDADLIGIPFRVTVSPRNLDKGVVEVKQRKSPDIRLVKADEAPAAILQMIRSGQTV